MSIYNSPTVLQKGLKAIEIYSGLKCGSETTVKRESQSETRKFYRVKHGAQ